jgi:hypothetical protein
MIKVSTTGMAVSLKTDLRFPESGQHGHGSRIIHLEPKNPHPFSVRAAKTFLLPTNQTQILHLTLLHFL